MFQLVFNGALSPARETARFYRRLRRRILKHTDPLVTWKVNGRTLRLHLSHQLPLYRREFPTYSANLERLAQLLRRQSGCLRMIDVGANIGDSVALAGVGPDDVCLLIEGDAGYFELLRQNTAELANTVCVQAMLSDQLGEAAVRLVSEGGTGKVVAGQSHGQRVCLATLDSILQDRPRFAQSQLLKIDVDGYDFRVLRGAAGFLHSARPVLFFEQDPLLLEKAGERPDEVWSWLREAGYETVFVYDNIGYWVGAFALSDLDTLCCLNRYARQRTGFYYDVAVFAPAHASIRDAFEAGEKAFYSALRPHA